MLAALERLHQAGVVEGRRGSLTFFRWSAAQPPRLAHIGLWGKAVDDELLGLTSQLPDLEFVSLYETDVDDDGLAALARLSKLRYLAVSPVCRYEKAGFGPPQWSYPFLSIRDGRPWITAAGLRPLESVATLEGLHLLDARLTSADLAILKSWPKLSTVSLPTPIDAEAVGHLAACPRLNQLTLGYREVTAAEIKHLAAWKSLRRLTLIHTRLADDALSALAGLETLEELRLEDCELTDDRLAHLRLAPQTKSLLLERNEIAGPGLAHLAKFSLETLGLEFNNLSDETLTHLPQLSTVADLRIAYCRQVTDRGIAGGTFERMPHVERLNLRGLKQVTDASLAPLSKLAHLAHLGIRETAISADGVARLKESLPKTVVFK